MITQPSSVSCRRTTATGLAAEGQRALVGRVVGGPREGTAVGLEFEAGPARAACNTARRDGGRGHGSALSPADAATTQPDWPAKPADHPLVLQDFVANDLATWPPQVKSYSEGLPGVELPRDWPPPTAPATAVLAGLATAPTVDAASLARTLFLSAGVVRTSRVATTAPCSSARPAPRAGASRWSSTSPPVASTASPTASTGTTRSVTPYGRSARPPAARRRRSWSPASRGAPAGATPSAASATSTGTPGTMLAQTLALAPGRLFTTFPDAQVTRLVGADGVQEWPVALVALEASVPAIEPGGEAVTGTIDEHPVEFPLVTMAQRAGDGDVLGAPWPDAPALDVSAPDSRDLDAVILQRGSTRLMDAGATVPRAGFEFALAAALRGIDVPHYIAVHGVEDVEPGLYRWPDIDDPAAAREPAPRAARGLLGPGPRPRRRVRRDERDRPRRARRSRLPRRPVRRRDRRRPPAPRRLRARASARPG